MKRYYQIYSVVFVAILFLFGLLTVLLPAREFSENENRYLNEFPKMETAKILDGKFQEDVTEAMNDQFPARDFWIRFTTVGEKLLGYKDIGGVYLGEDNYYITKTLDADISKPQFLKNLRYTEYFAGKLKKKPVVLLVPSAGSVLGEKLPRFGSMYDSDILYDTAQMLFDKAELLDIRDAAEENRYKQLYYRTDHHWTLSGAFVGYEAYCEYKGMVAKPFAEFIPKRVTSEFYGTLYSKTLDPAAIADEIYAPQGALWESALMTVDDEEESLSIYSREKLEEKDKYAYFLGGNYGKVTIQSATQEGAGKKILIIKDSFANSFVPFLLNDYQSITMIDLRYYTDSVLRLAKKEKYTDVLILYEMSNYADDKNLFKLTQ